MVERVRLRAGKKRIMREFSIDEISAVDRPAQAHARMTLMKRSGNDVNKDDYGAPQAIVQEVQALTFDEVLAEQGAREAACQVKDNIYARWWALQRSFETIAADDEVSPQDKVSSMQDSLRQFIASLAEESKTIAEAVTKSLSAVPALAELLNPDGNSSEGDTEMTAAEKKQLEELQKQVEDLTKKLEAASSDDPAAKAAELQQALDEATAKVEELTEKLATSEDEAAKARMSPEEREFMTTLDKEGKGKFLAMSADERKKAMKKSLDNDETVLVGGHTVRKSAVGEAQFAIIKAQQDELAKQADELRKEREAREAAQLTKRAEDELSHMPGETAEKVTVLHAIEKMDEAPRVALTKMLAVGDKAVAAAYDTIGHRGDKARKSAEDFKKRIAEVAARDKISKSEAMAKARAEFPEEFEAYQNGEPQ